MTKTSPKLSDDLLFGVEQIAIELFGVFDKKTRRRTYHLLERGQIPGRKNGGQWISWRSRLAEHFAPDEAA